MAKRASKGAKCDCQGICQVVCEHMVHRASYAAKDAVNSEHYVLHATAKGSARTLLGPIL